MTSYDRGIKPEKGKYLSFDHLTFFVGNAKQAASYYVTRLGFEYLAYQGLETGHREYAKHVVKQKNIIFVFVTPYESDDIEFGQFLTKHGDGVKDIVLDVEDLDVIVERAKERGGQIVKDIWEEKDEFGSCRFATIYTIGDITHTFVDRKNYNGIFLPGYTSHYLQNDAIVKLLPECNLDYVDHIDINLPVGGMEPLAEWYVKTLMFHRFWSVDDSQIHTEYSAMKAIFVTNFEESVKVSLNEPANGKKRSQIQEFVDYNDGPGIQHIALHTDDIVESCTKLRERGMGFLQVPDTYYDMLKARLKADKFEIVEDIEVLRKLKILIDYDENGYLLQIFTKTMEDRPTLFLEVIQRRNHNGFGAGNFKALFEAIELDQAQRGNL